MMGYVTEEIHNFAENFVSNLLLSHFSGNLVAQNDLAYGKINNFSNFWITKFYLFDSKFCHLKRFSIWFEAKTKPEQIFHFQLCNADRGKLKFTFMETKPSEKY